MVPICANIASQQFRFAYDRLKGACILCTLTFFPNFEHLKQLKELNGVDKLGTELEIAQNWAPNPLAFPSQKKTLVYKWSQRWLMYHRVRVN